MGGAARGVCAGQRTIWWTFGWTEHFVEAQGAPWGSLATLPPWVAVLVKHGQAQL